MRVGKQMGDYCITLAQTKSGLDQDGSRGNFKKSTLYILLI